MSRRVFRSALCVLLVISSLQCAGCIGNGADELGEEADFSNASYICELSTLEVYYHNVAQMSQDSDVLFGIGNIGYKKMWFEYSGIVEVGIGASRVEVSQPDAQNVVTISLPQAEILSVNLDETTISDPVVETGLFTSLETEEKTKSLGEAQKGMKEEAEKDDSLKFQARQRAKEMLESYVKNVGELVGDDYDVRWVDA